MINDPPVVDHDTLGNHYLGGMFSPDGMHPSNSNQKVRGSPLAGLPETLGPKLGISGDLHDFLGAPAAAPSLKIDKSLGQPFMQQYLAAQRSASVGGVGLNEAVAAMHEVCRF